MNYYIVWVGGNIVYDDVIMEEVINEPILCK